MLLPFLRIHIVNIQALIIRDIMLRFGRGNLGFVWTVLEPMILTTGVLGLWSPLSHLDIVVARLVLEFLSTTAALAVIYMILLAIGLAEPVQDWGLLLAAWLFTAWFHAGGGLLIAAATEVYETTEKFIQPIQYLALPLSGVFFMVDWLPSDFQRLILWNPSVHCFEMFRAGYFGEAVVTHYDPLYLALWSASLTVLGVAAILAARDHVHT